jgi:hypothetical protein
MTRGGEVRFRNLRCRTDAFRVFRRVRPSDQPCAVLCAKPDCKLCTDLEHEPVHLAEQLCWAASNCGAPRFQGIAHRYFLHRAHTYNLITWRERAAQSGIRVGSYVGFTFEGRQLTGRVNRLTRRARVLVEDPGAPRYSDGRRYRRYYVALGAMQPVRVHSAD